MSRLRRGAAWLVARDIVLQGLVSKEGSKFMHKKNGYFAAAALALVMMAIVVSGNTCRADIRFTSEHGNTQENGLDHPHPADAVKARSGGLRTHSRIDNGSEGLNVVLRGRVVDGRFGTGIRTRIEYDGNAFWSDSDGWFYTRMAMAPSALVFRCNGYEGQVVASSEFVDAARPRVVRLECISTVRFVYGDGSPAEGAIVHVNSSVDKFGGDYEYIVGAEGFCDEIRPGNVVWAESGVLTSDVALVKAGAQEIRVDRVGLHVRLNVKQNEPESLYKFMMECIKEGKQVFFPISLIRDEMYVPQILWTFGSIPQTGVCINTEESAAPMKISGEGYKIRLRSLDAQGEINLVFDTLKDYVVVRDRDGKGIIREAFAMLSIYSARHVDRLMSSSVFRTREDGKLWWSGLHTELRFRDDLLTRLEIGAPGYRSSVLEAPQRALRPGDTVFLEHCPVYEFRLSLMYAGGSMYRGRVNVSYGVTGDVLYSGIYERPIAIQSCEGTHVRIETSVGVVEAYLGDSRNIRVDVGEAGMVEVRIPSTVNEDVVLWNQGGIFERSGTHIESDCSVVVFQYLPPGLYGVAPRDKADCFKQLQCRIDNPVLVESAGVSVVDWDDAWLCMARLTGEVIGLSGVAEDVDWYVWPVYSPLSSYGQVPSGPVRGRLFRVRKDHTYTLNDVSASVAGVYLVGRMKGVSDFIAGFSYRVSSIQADIDDLVVSPSGKGGYIRPSGNIGPLMRDGGAWGNLWIEVSEARSTTVSGVSEELGNATHRYRFGDKGWRTLEKNIVRMGDEMFLDIR